MQLAERYFLWPPLFKPVCIWRWDLVTISTSISPVFISSPLFVLAAGFDNRIFSFSLSSLPPADGFFFFFQALWPGDFDQPLKAPCHHYKRRCDHHPPPQVVHCRLPYVRFAFIRSRVCDRIQRKPQRNQQALVSQGVTGVSPWGCVFALDGCNLQLFK